jgi:YVTN family beta-propeller protein
MRFAVLGPLEAIGDRGPLALGGRKQRTLLAVLLLRANEFVSREALIDALWGERPPPSAAESLDTYVYRLRKLLGYERLVRQPSGGYLLRVDVGEIDVEHFELLVASARGASDAGDQAAAVEALTEALGLWRGPAWGDLIDDLLVNADRQRLEDMRLSAFEDRVEARLAMGAGKELIPELEALLEDHPLRERLLAALMLALYRAGRQTDALDLFKDARSRLVDELALEPGPALHDMQRRILEHDPALGAPLRFVAVSGTGLRRRLVVTGAAVFGTVLAIVFLFGSGAAAPRPPRLAGADALVALSVGSGRLVSATRLGGAPGAVGGGDGSVWVADPGAGEVSRVDPASGVVIDQILVGGGPGSLISGGGAIWVASSIDATVTRIDPTTESITQTISLPGSNPGAIAYGAGGVWVADSAARQLFELDPATDQLERTLALDVQPSAIAVSGGAVWVAGYDDATIERLNPDSGRVTARVHVGDGPAAVTFAAGSLWVANSLDSTVSRIDPTTLGVMSTIPVGSGPTALAAAGGSIWVANQYADTVSRIDPRRNRVIATVAVTGEPTSLIASGSRIWAGVATVSGRHRNGTLVIVSPSALTSYDPATGAFVDPAFYQAANNPQFIGLAYDSLVTFQQSPGAAGLRLVPDLAVSIPTPTDHGRRYSFQIRPGIRYSDGQPLRADDFRRAVERLFRVGSPYTTYFATLVGATACISAPRTCDLSRGIVTDDATRTVTFQLAARDPQFLFNLTVQGTSVPVPPGTPDHVAGSRTVPGTGPYEIASVSATEIRFVRNPFFREWSHAAQPTGNPNSIVWRRVPTITAAVSAVEQGQADWMWAQVPAAQYQQLELEDPAQLHTNPQFSIEYVVINTHAAPFNDLRVRQALNYAINRSTIVGLYGGPVFATPTCQTIPPGLPGYRRYCPYTLHPRSDGAWGAPDMARARRLVRESGTLGERVDLWGSPDEGFIPPTEPEYIASVLRALGYNVHLHLVPFDSITTAMWRRFQISVEGDWEANYPDPSAYLPLFLTCGGSLSNGYYCNRALDREMQHAGQLELNSPPRATALWETIDRQLTNAAVWAPTVTFRDVEITARALHNYQYNPLWGFLADQSWIG